MKTPHLLTALICGGITSASAFTVDFTQHFRAATLAGVNSASGSSLPFNTPIVVDVPGYGNVEFQIGRIPAPALNSATVTQRFTNDSSDPINALEFKDDTAISVSFTGAVPLNVDFDFVGVGLGEKFAISKSSEQIYGLSFTESAGVLDAQAGLRSISFNAVPEPSSALLSSLAALGLLRRRR